MRPVGVDVKALPDKAGLILDVNEETLSDKAWLALIWRQILICSKRYDYQKSNREFQLMCG